jgi:hypothetical protein
VFFVLFGDEEIKVIRFLNNHYSLTDLTIFIQNFNSAKIKLQLMEDRQKNCILGYFQT